MWYVIGPQGGLVEADEQGNILEQKVEVLEPAKEPEAPVEGTAESTEAAPVLSSIVPVVPAGPVLPKVSK